MNHILGIETSCDETAAAVFDCSQQKIRSSTLFSQIALHEKYGGIVPEIASRSQLEKIDLIVQEALDLAPVGLDAIETIAVTYKPGLAGSLLVGACFAKGLAWANQKRLIGVNHIEAHIFSVFLQEDGSVNQDIRFPFLCMSASGGHTAIYMVRDFGEYEIIAQTIDDAAGEAFDKIAKSLGFGYPGGALIEKMATNVAFQDFFKYPRTKLVAGRPFFSFSGIKTAVLYSLVKQGAYDLASGPVKAYLSEELKHKVASSLLVCIGDIFCNNIKASFALYPELTGCAFVGGVACNRYLRSRLSGLCERAQKSFFVSPSKFSTDNGAMVAFVGSYKAARNQFDTLFLDILK